LKGTYWEHIENKGKNVARDSLWEHIGNLVGTHRDLEGNMLGTKEKSKKSFPPYPNRPPTKT